MLRVADGETAEAARKKFDRDVQTGEWGTPWNLDPGPDPLAGTPWWWNGDDDASSSFLREMGVNLG